jgi:hypothetical protein
LNGSDEKRARGCEHAGRARAKAERGEGGKEGAPVEHDLESNARAARHEDKKRPDAAASGLGAAAKIVYVGDELTFAESVGDDRSVLNRGPEVVADSTIFWSYPPDPLVLMLTCRSAAVLKSR